jgi:hypothetical protein
MQDVGAELVRHMRRQSMEEMLAGELASNLKTREEKEIYIQGRASGLAWALDCLQGLGEHRHKEPDF